MRTSKELHDHIDLVGYCYERPNSFQELVLKILVDITERLEDLDRQNSYRYGEIKILKRD